MEPPGWITAVAPASAAASRPSAKGKKASDATALPMVRGDAGLPPLLDAAYDPWPSAIAGAWQDAGGAVVSGVEKKFKPNADFYELALQRFGLNAGQCVFFDDTAKNVTGAENVGIRAFRFTDADQARRDLESLGLKF